MSKYKEVVYSKTFYSCEVVGLSRRDILKYRPIKTSTTISVGEHGWCACKSQKILTVLGPRIFWRETAKQFLTLKDNRLYGNIRPFIADLIEALELDWLREPNLWCQRLLEDRKDLWKEVFIGRITNPRDLARAFSKKYFGGVYSVASLKNYFSRVCYYDNISLWNIFYYTVNPDLALRSLVDKGSEYSRLLIDMLEYCAKDNTKINPKWSLRRLTEEHQKQIEADLLSEEVVQKISDTPIASPLQAEGLSLILDERTCYLEGIRMHNCVHTCYWDKIQEGRYLIAKGIINDMYVDLGISVQVEVNGIFFDLDQIHTIYNGGVSNVVMEAATNWIKCHRKALCSAWEEIQRFRGKRLTAKLQNQLNR